MKSRVLIAGAILLTMVITGAAQNSPKHGIAWLDGKGDLQITYAKGVAGVALGMESFVFDPAKKSAGEPSGFLMETKESPVAIVIINPLSGSASAKYSNIEINVEELQGKPMDIRAIEEVTPESKYLCSVALLVSGHKTITISDTYQVFADGKAGVSQGGPYVRLRFENMRGNSDSATLSIVRNGSQIVKSPLPAVLREGVLISEVKAANDSLDWSISDASGAIMKKGSLGFPVYGASPDLVDYAVNLEKIQ